MLSSSKRGCFSHLDNFCYVCGEHTPLAHSIKLNSRIKYAYKHYFACQVGATLFRLLQIEIANRNIKFANRPHIFAATIAKQVFCFGWILNGRKHLVLFSSCGENQMVTLLTATSARQTSEDFLENISPKFLTSCASQLLN